ncbi:Nn.00g025300.m01.CDS01 [Neocucurbitaria sp. VM-36]
MGSKISKAVRPHVKAAATPVATTRSDANEARARQEPALHLPDKYGNDDIQIATSTTTRNTPQRRNSEPARPPPIASNTSMERSEDSVAAFSLFLAEHQLMSIEYGANDPTPRTPTVALPPPPPPASWVPPSPGAEEIQCLICCIQLPKEKDPRYIKEVITPCKTCTNAYCISCVKKMFTDACRDLTRMPPRCCVPIHLHHVRPYLSQAEVAEFKSKYEEWSTPNPFYCPVPTCSVFIPERLLPQQAKPNGKRTDSGVGTPTTNTFPCPTCDARLCVGCRQGAHPDSMCTVAEFGIDAETAALLKSWGYKKCPKCGHGLKRMFGCNHMECRCGAHFCWVCLEGRNECDGGCYDGEDEEFVSDDELDEPAEPMSQPNATERVEPNDGNLSTSIAADAVAETSHEANQTTSPPQPAVRPRNLDGGGDRYWEEQDLDFGAEPTDDIQDRSWQCRHDFSTYKINLASALTSTTEIECVKCWCTIHPEIEAWTTQRKATDKIVPASAGARPRGIGRGRGRGVGAYLPPRGLFRADAIVGTAPHLMAALSPLSQSVPTREASPMEDVQYTDRVVDTYGNVIATTELHDQRRASLDSSPQNFVVPSGQGSNKKPLDDYKFTFRPLSDVFATTATKFSLAHECHRCGLLVCQPCKDAAMGSTPETSGEGIENSDPEPLPFD